MGNIILTDSELVKLINEKNLNLGKDTSIELKNNDIIYNANNNAHKLIQISIKYEKKELDHNEIINDLQNAICEHFNLDLHNINFVSLNDEIAIFKIKFNQASESFLIIWDRHKYKDLNNSIKSFEELDNYKKLGNTQYYFRWLCD